MRTTDAQSEVVPNYPLGDTAHAGFLLKRMDEIEQERPADEGPHRHSFYTVIWLKEGRGTHTIDFRSFPLRPNTVYFLTPEQIHFLEATEAPQGYVLEFSAEYLAAQGIPFSYLTELQLFFNCDEVQPLTFSTEVAQQLLLPLEAMAQEQATKDLRWLEKIGALLKAWLIDCHRQRLMQQGKAAELPSAASRLVREYKALVEIHYRAWHKVTDYADALAVSSGHLSEVIKAETHRPAKQIIMDRLMLEARRTARFTAYTLKEAAHALGFDDPSHFAKVFKKEVGSSFLDFRQQAAVQ